MSARIAAALAALVLLLTMTGCTKTVQVFQKCAGPDGIYAVYQEDTDTGKRTYEGQRRVRNDSDCRP